MFCSFHIDVRPCFSWCSSCDFLLYAYNSIYSSVRYIRLFRINSKLGCSFTINTMLVLQYFDTNNQTSGVVLADNKHGLIKLQGLLSLIKKTIQTKRRCSDVPTVGAHILFLNLFILSICILMFQTCGAFHKKFAK